MFPKKSNLGQFAILRGAEESALASPSGGGAEAYDEAERAYAVQICPLSLASLAPTKMLSLRGRRPWQSPTAMLSLRGRRPWQSPSLEQQGFSSRKRLINRHFSHPLRGDFVNSNKKELTFRNYDIRIILMHYALIRAERIR